MSRPSMVFGVINQCSDSDGLSPVSQCLKNPQSILDVIKKFVQRRCHFSFFAPSNHPRVGVVLRKFVILLNLFAFYDSTLKLSSSHFQYHSDAEYVLLINSYFSFLFLLCAPQCVVEANIVIQSD